MKISLKNKGEIRPFLNKQELREFITSKNQKEVFTLKFRNGNSDLHKAKKNTENLYLQKEMKNTRNGEYLN